MNTQPKSIQELADLYGVHYATMIRWLKPIKEELLKMNGRRIKRLRHIRKNQLERIIEFLGEV